MRYFNFLDAISMNNRLYTHICISFLLVCIYSSIGPEVQNSQSFTHMNIFKSDAEYFFKSHFILFLYHVLIFYFCKIIAIGSRVDQFTDFFRDL